MTVFIILLAETLIRKWNKAKDDVIATGASFRELSNCLDQAWIVEWTRAEEKAMRERGKALEIYDVVIDKGKA